MLLLSNPNLSRIHDSNVFSTGYSYISANVQEPTMLLKIWLTITERPANTPVQEADSCA